MKQLKIKKFKEGNFSEKLVLEDGMNPKIIIGSDIKPIELGETEFKLEDLTKLGELTHDHLTWKLFIIAQDEKAILVIQKEGKSIYPDPTKWDTSIEAYELPWGINESSI